MCEDCEEGCAGGIMCVLRRASVYSLDVKSVFCVFGVGLNTLCILCIWGPENRFIAVVYCCVFVPGSDTRVFWCI